MLVLAVIVWIVALLVALITTIIALLLVLRVIAHLRVIDHLAREALVSIEGIGRHAHALSTMPAVVAAADQLGVAVAEIERIAASLGVKLRSLGLVS
ncbi:hypothetical protein HRbin28_02689 [bacterium HR28]|uniref:Uncharacterized protein n=1 Tax=Thermomicrobium roseum TaxID=500 RepID=A0A7C1JWE1_THERO|nr:hypothetical protein HRbin28_02689 [bacterium HR28]